MRKREKKGIINTLLAAGANVVDDTTAKAWYVTDATGGAPLFPPVPYGHGVSVEKFTSQAEKPELKVIGAGTVETVVAGRVYGLQIGTGNQTFQTEPDTVHPYNYTAPAILTGDADTDRYNLYDGLAKRINAHFRNFVSASKLTKATYTLGTSAGGAFAVGDTVTQETSGETAVIAKLGTITGTFAGDDAAGDLWLKDVSDESAWLETAKKLTADAGGVVTVTNATTTHGQGLAILDDANYFNSSKFRGGISDLYITRGFQTVTTSSIEKTVTGQYAIGIGSDLLARMPVFDRDGLDIEKGDGSLLFQSLPDATKTYTIFNITVKYVMVDFSGMKEVFDVTNQVYVSEGNATNLTNFGNALDTALAK